MTNTLDIDKIVENATMIVCGYAFSKMNDGNIRIISIEPPYHASIIQPDGEILETNMDDIEIEIVNDYWKRNKKFMEDNIYA
jgi:hypothetical protein